MAGRAETSDREETMFTPTPPHAPPIIKERRTTNGWAVYVESWLPGGTPGSIMRQGKYYNLALENGIYRTNLSGRTPLYRESMIPLDGTPSTSAMVRLRMDQIRHTIQDHRDAVLEHEAEQDALRRECEGIETIDMCSVEDECEHIGSTFESQGTQMDPPQGQ